MSRFALTTYVIPPQGRNDKKASFQLTRAIRDNWSD